MPSEEQQHSQSMKNLCLNHAGCFQSALLPRKESIEDTLGFFDLEDTFKTNKNILDRTSHLYRTSADALKAVRENMIRITDFTYVEIMHRSSFLGLPYQIYAKHASGYELYFDGLSYLTYKQVESDAYNLTDIKDLAGYPQRADAVVFSLEKAISDLLPNMDKHSYTMYSFYTTDVEEWKGIGIHATGEPQLRVEVIDENFVTLIGGQHAEFGKSFPLYIGDSRTIREMISHEMFFSSEYSRFSAYVDEKRKEVANAQRAIAKSVRSISRSFWHMVEKYKSWKSAKRGIAKLYELRERTITLDLFCETLSDILENRWSSRNFPKQIWLSDEEMDDQWQASSWCSNFLSGRLVDDKIVDLKEQPVHPVYTGTARESISKVSLFKEELRRAVEDGRDLRSIIQADFSLYAVSWAVIALVFSLVIGLVAVVV